ncbi:hypothetical protein [Burkholderia metallica]|uniref:hypothetical protein n=1 Tax=Burkholderia metallica TaxID=488729 RepID=UPI001CF36574|nr:hypothetical protein [Burkholderia metallica]MCA8003341.1 hypothetical protein [Burkholderia metallica]
MNGIQPRQIQFPELAAPSVTAHEPTLATPHPPQAASPSNASRSASGLLEGLPPFRAPRTGINTIATVGTIPVRQTQRVRAPRQTLASNGGRDTVVREDSVSFSTHRVCFPSVSSCLTVTGVSSQGLHAAHIPTGSQSGNEYLENMVDAMNASGCKTFYVIGAIKTFKSNVAGSNFNSQYNISEYLKGKASNATVKFFDTSDHGNVNIYVEKQGDSVTATYGSATEPGNHVIGNQYPTPSTAMTIDADRFIERKLKLKF